MIKLKEVLKQYRNTHRVEDKNYKQVTISQTGEVFYRGTKHGSSIGRKRQFIIDLKNHPNTLIFIRQGVYKGGIGICPPEVDGCIVTENMPMFDIVNINPKYLLHYLKSPQFKEQVDKLVPLGTAQKAVHERQLLEIEIPLPSEEIQREIVDNLEKNSKSLIEFSSLNSLNESYILKLRQAILQEAVQGKLIPQDPNDEPASELLQKSKEVTKTLFDLPINWDWYALDTVSDYIQRGKSPEYSENSKIPVISQKCVQWSGFDMTKARFISPSSFNKYDKSRILQDGDLLWNSTGDGTLGRVCLYSLNLNPYKIAVADSHVTIVRANKKFLLPKYLLIWLSSKFVQDRLDISGSTKQTELATSTIRAQLVPLPPLSEQKQIVEKVNKLMAYCDELERRVKENRVNSKQLMEVVLSENFSV